MSPLLGWGARLSHAGRGMASPPAQPGLLVGEGPPEPPGCCLRCSAGIYRGSAGLLGRTLCKQAPGGSPALESLRTNWNKGNLRRGGKGTKSWQELFPRPPVAGTELGGRSETEAQAPSVGSGPPSPRQPSDTWLSEVWRDAR